MHPGFISAWATGLGKTIAAFLWPLLKVGYRKADGRWQFLQLPSPNPYLQKSAHIQTWQARR